MVLTPDNKRHWSLFQGLDIRESDDPLDFKIINGGRSHRFRKHCQDLSTFPSLIYYYNTKSVRTTTRHVGKPRHPDHFFKVLRGALNLCRRVGNISIAIRSVRTLQHLAGEVVP